MIRRQAIQLIYLCIKSHRMKTNSIFFIFLLFSAALSAQENADPFDFDRIEDNSFLLEEAYNQEPGVIQHISAFQYMKSESWYYTFTEEWPCPNQKHQVSVTLPIMSGASASIGDVLLNYRYQAIFNTRMAFSPRLSFLLPTGDHNVGAGFGSPGIQANLPFSYVLNKKFVMHLNAGLTIVPSAKGPSGMTYDFWNVNYGASLICLLTSKLNLMCEVSGNSSWMKFHPTGAKSGTINSIYINPGLRYAIDFKSGLQIVPGLAMPIEVADAGGAYGVFGYLSLEHPLWKP